MLFVQDSGSMLMIAGAVALSGNAECATVPCVTNTREQGIQPDLVPVTAGYGWVVGVCFYDRVRVPCAV